MTQYKHPKKYSNRMSGTILDTEKVQNRFRWMVEHFCTECTMFKEHKHDFEDCCTGNGRFLKKCPKEFGKIEIPADDTIVLRLEVEE